MGTGILAFARILNFILQETETALKQPSSSKRTSIFTQKHVIILTQHHSHPNKAPHVSYLMCPSAGGGELKLGKPGHKTGHHLACPVLSDQEVAGGYNMCLSPSNPLQYTSLPLTHTQSSTLVGL